MLTGTFFLNNKEYFISRNRTHWYDLIIDNESHLKALREISTYPFSIENLNWNNLSEEDKIGIKNNNEKWGKIEKDSILKIELSMVDIQGDDGYLHSFCFDTRSDIFIKYGSCKFILSIQFLEDYFIDIQRLRDEKIR